MMMITATADNDGARSTKKNKNKIEVVVCRQRLSVNVLLLTSWIMFFATGFPLLWIHLSYLFQSYNNSSSITSTTNVVNDDEDYSNGILPIIINNKKDNKKDIFKKFHHSNNKKFLSNTAYDVVLFDDCDMFNSSITTQRQMIYERRTKSLRYKQKLVSVCIAVYEGLQYVEQIMETVLNQTYTNLEILISIDASDDAKETELRFQQIKDKLYPNNNNIHIFYQKDRMHWANNIDFLFDMSTGDYVSIMQHDDTIPPDYYEKLVQCLDDNPDAVNCYPFIITIKDKNFNADIPNEFRQPSIIGVQHERVEQVMNQCCGVSFRGLIRRPIHGSMKPFYVPRLYKNFFNADLLQMLNHAIAGQLIEVNVPYYKSFRHDTLHNAQIHNKTIKPLDDILKGFLDLYVSEYNTAHSYASSSKKAAMLTESRLSFNIQDYINKRSEEASRLVNPLQTYINKFWINIQKQKRVAVLGAGIQGCVVALMFQKHGYDVTLIDKSNDIMNRASQAGVGRIHVGLEYSNDRSMKTGEYMMNSALRFASYIEYLIGTKVDWSKLHSERMKYLIPYDSIITPKEFEDFANKLEIIYEDLLSTDETLSYFGERPPKILIEKTTLPNVVNASYFQAAYDTIEVAVSLRMLKSILRDAVYESTIKLAFNRTVYKVQRNSIMDDTKLGKLRVLSNVGEHDFDAVVNCLWESRASIDKTMGVDNNAQNENIRLKFGIRFPDIENLSNIPSISVVNGPFGDFIRYPEDVGVYFSWHPISIHGMTQNETVMRGWEELANLNIPTDIAEYQLKSHREIFHKIFPGFKGDDPFPCNVLTAGYTVGNGITDIIDPESELHERCDNPFIIDDGYISMKTQKLTSAPYNAYLLEKSIFKDTLVAKQNTIN